MDFLKDIGKVTGNITGKLLGGTVRVAGELIHSDYIKEIGNNVERLTSKTGQIAGQVASGVWDTGAGLITADKDQAKTGLNDLEDAVTTTVKGVGNGIEYVVESGKDVVNGIKDNNNELLKDGVKKLGIAAAITVLAVGVVDIIDGPDGSDSGTT